ncbi:MAG: site-specific DNA-methyltransferase [Ignavibacteria bacterium]|nr:site-specific DNA-methyltransferase [Ignavibacteria bacterium]
MALTLAYSESDEYLTIKEASIWASEHLKKDVTTSNISYLVSYGKIRKTGENGTSLIKKDDLLQYYKSFYGTREINWKEQLGKDLNWHLSFDYLKESDTTKHVHRLHPYKGKYIPQLVEYFLDNHTDEFKKETYFKKGDIVLDPFCGSGTTLIQANELGINAIGIDISDFNAHISNSKITKYNLPDVVSELNIISKKLKQFIEKSPSIKFEERLMEQLTIFNNKYFPSPEFKHWLKDKTIKEGEYSDEKVKRFQPIFDKLIEEYDIQLKQNEQVKFLDQWYLQPVRNEIDFVFNLVKQIKCVPTKKIISIILSRTVRTCRATSHADLATLLEPISSTYYCSKHGKICKPLFSIYSWWERYAKDTIKRLVEFDRLRTNTSQICLRGDSRTIDIFKELEVKFPEFGNVVKEKKINGIFSSPPYVGLIDYHEQHAYAYDLFGFERHDDLEIGPLSKKQTKEAQRLYVEGISAVLNNCKQYLADDYNVFLVSNDKFNLYPTIAENVGMKIVNQFKRPVLNRTEKDKAAYSEIIFHLKEI